MTTVTTPAQQIGTRELWDRYKKYLCDVPGVGLRIDPSRMDLDDAFLEKMDSPMQRAFAAMRELEGGAIANPDEGRMVGHYWLRDAKRAPSPDMTAVIESTVDAIEDFAQKVHTGAIKPPTAERFENLILIGIGGSALGPQFVSDALVDLDKPGALRCFYIDNTDPDGIDRCFDRVRKTGGGLAATLTVVISKSGSTPEPRNGMLEAQNAYKQDDLDFAPHAVAITMEGSKLDKMALESQWLWRFPLWDWVGGRTSELSAVGLVPAALEGVDIRGMLEGARQMDEATRVEDKLANPAALLALCWYLSGNGRGEKDMVILPYKDRLLFLSRYLQQLVMESLGKRLDLDGEVVNQGIAVYGNKGSTDQHAYVQQLRDGVPNFFATFIHVREDRNGPTLEVEDGVNSGDYLLGFFLGTRSALHEAGRGSVTITVPRVDAQEVGKLIALFERAVGFYATLANINAYHQPGVEAGKKAAASVLEIQAKLFAYLEANKGSFRTAEEIAASLGSEDDVETIFHILEHRAANPDGGVESEPGDSPWNATFGKR